jgi:hypothetical protein
MEHSTGTASYVRMLRSALQFGIVCFAAAVKIFEKHNERKKRRLIGAGSYQNSTSLVNYVDSRRYMMSITFKTPPVTHYGWNRD